MSSKPRKVIIQLAIFEETLDRLIKGEGRYVDSGTKLSMAQLAKEAGVGSGTLYYQPYAEFRIRAAKLIAQYNAGTGENKCIPSSHRAELQALRDDRNNEKRLKEEYRNSRDELRAQVKRLCAELGAVEHALYEATLRAADLELKLEKATGMTPYEQHAKESNRAALLPRNLQLIK